MKTKARAISCVSTAAMTCVFAHLGVAQPQPPLLPLIPPGQYASEERLRAGEAEFAALRELAIRSEAEQPIKEQALDELARRLGVPRVIEGADGRRLILADEIAGAPAYIGSPSPVLGDRDVQLYGRAYDSLPNTPTYPVIVPEPSALALLIAGGALLLFRRKRHERMG